jgi:SAM-dependent methyltransferase
MKEINDIKSATIERYSKRYSKLGRDVKTLGWGTKEQQYYRFECTLDYGDLSGKTILDIGCGFGDYLDFLVSKKIPFKKYIGWDINPDLINEAKKTYASNKKAEFEVVDIFSDSFKLSQPVDVVLMLGLLNFNLKESYNNYEYSKLFIAKAFSFAQEGFISDFLSTYKTPDYPAEDFVFYHDPKVMLDFSLTLTPQVVLKHNYNPIPQKEFMLFIYK